jgi:hypothetical protein
MLQSNGHASLLRFTPASQPGAPALASLVRMNVSADGWASRIEAGSIFLVAAAQGTDAAYAVAQHFADGPPCQLLYVPGEDAHSMAQLLAAGLRKDARAAEGSEAAAWRSAQAAGLDGVRRGDCTVMVADAGVAARILCCALGLPAECASAIALEAGGVSVLRPDPAGGWATAHCINDVQ